MEKYDPALLQKEQLVVINKIDIRSDADRDIADIKRAVEDMGLDALPVSALTGEGLEALKRVLSRKFFDD